MEQHKNKQYIKDFPGRVMLQNVKCLEISHEKVSINYSFWQKFRLFQNAHTLNMKVLIPIQIKSIPFNIGCVSKLGRKQ